ncbi:MAG TPA: hypothetical protein VFF30_06425 [Nitrososphaerales archaeon]|nr:hypothetical protein [Nitrososphaerales archaeon]
MSTVDQIEVTPETIRQQRIAYNLFYVRNPEEDMHIRTFFAANSAEAESKANDFLQTMRDPEAFGYLVPSINCTVIGPVMLKELKTASKRSNRQEKMST